MVRKKRRTKCLRPVCLLCCDSPVASLACLPAPPSVRLHRRKIRTGLFAYSLGREVCIPPPRIVLWRPASPALPCHATKPALSYTRFLNLRHPALTPRYITTPDSTTNPPPPYSYPQTLNPLFSSTSHPSPHPHSPHRHPHPPYSCSSPSSRYQSTSS